MDPSASTGASNIPPNSSSTNASASDDSALSMARIPSEPAHNGSILDQDEVSGPSSNGDSFSTVTLTEKIVTIPSDPRYLSHHWNLAVTKARTKLKSRSEKKDLEKWIRIETCSDPMEPDGGQVVKSLIKYGAHVNSQGANNSKDEYCTALQWAAFYGLREVVQLLIQTGADVNSQGFGYNFSGDFYLGAVRGRYCIPEGAQGGKYGSPLYAAAEEGHKEVAQLLIQEGTDVNAQGGGYGNALQAAAYKGHETVVQLLIQERADVNAQSDEYGSPLHAAAKRGTMRWSNYYYRMAPTKMI
ncbi:ankyrin [Ascodesmis nigricans]|uniref:Ankyrin n=1 Tax=Ascodesmis nigricans TaxID=341454 RepID=A0A4S2MSS1_9PEZI|nr:ankyrin [Ascodesmis nigricans]